MGLDRAAHRREPDEFLEVHRLRWSRVLDLIRSGTLVDAKTLAALLFVERFERGR